MASEKVKELARNQELWVGSPWLVGMPVIFALTAAVLGASWLGWWLIGLIPGLALAAILGKSAKHAILDVVDAELRVHGPADPAGSVSMAEVERALHETLGNRAVAHGVIGIVEVRTPRGSGG